MICPEMVINSILAAVDEQNTKSNGEHLDSVHLYGEALGEVVEAWHNVKINNAHDATVDVLRVTAILFRWLQKFGEIKNEKCE